MTASPRPTVARRGRGNRTPWESPTRTVRVFMRASCGDFTVITATASSQACRCSAGGGDRARGIVWVSAPTAAGKRSLVGSRSQVVPHPIPAPIRTTSASQRPRLCCRHSYQSLRPPRRLRPPRYWPSGAAARPRGPDFELRVVRPMARAPHAVHPTSGSASRRAVAHRHRSSHSDRRWCTA